VGYFFGAVWRDTMAIIRLGASPVSTSFADRFRSAICVYALVAIVKKRLGLIACPIESSAFNHFFALRDSLLLWIPAVVEILISSMDQKIPRAHLSRSLKPRGRIVLYLFRLQLTRETRNDD
jgi:hypothetical protein